MSKSKQTHTINQDRLAAVGAEIEAARARHRANQEHIFVLLGRQKTTATELEIAGLLKISTRRELLRLRKARRRLITGKN